MDAAQRWSEAAALLRRAGTAPRALRDWLGPAWAGPAARAFAQWAEEFDSAVRRASLGVAGVAAIAAEGVTRRGQLERRLAAELVGLRREVRGLAEVRLPSSSPRPADSVAGSAERERRKPVVPHRGVHGSRGGVPEWVEQAITLLLRHGYRADQLDAEDIQTIIRYESSGNPAAVNRWDRNAANGTPSMGLMQTIPPTFDHYALPGHDNILDPVDNIIAGVRYAVDRYGSVSQVPGIVSLREGGGYRGY